jgi:uncharacterized FlaG/YvyC family protein
MEIGLNNRVTLTPTASVPAASLEDPTKVRQIVTAIRELNKSEMLGQNRSLGFIRNPDSQRPVIQIMNRETGEVIDQIPSEAVLQMAAELDQLAKAKEK